MMKYQTKNPKQKDFLIYLFLLHWSMTHNLLNIISSVQRTEEISETVLPI